MDLKKQYSSDKNPFWADRIGRSGGAIFVFTNRIYHKRTKKQKRQILNYQNYNLGVPTP